MGTLAGFSVIGAARLMSALAKTCRIEALMLSNSAWERSNPAPAEPRLPLMARWNASTSTSPPAPAAVTVPFRTGTSDCK